MLSLSRHAATDRVALAEALTSRLPGTLAALGAAELDLTRARVIVAATDVLPAEQAAAVEARVLPRAGCQTAPALRESCARAVIAADPDAAHRRHEQAVTDRAARLYPAEDGMATLWARLAAADALAAFESLRRAADAAKTPDDDRTAEARRADTLLDLLLAADPDADHSPAGTEPEVTQPEVTQPEHDLVNTRADTAAPGSSGAQDDHPAGAPDAEPTRRAAPAWARRPTHTGAAVHVTAPWTTLAGLDDQPCELRGYGPITAQLARIIAADATWRRILTDPASGTVRDVGRATYPPPAALAEFVRVRDGHCRFPGCRHPAVTRAGRLDLDHTEPFPRGPTAEYNLDTLCRHHHLIKTHTHWKVRQRWEGSLLWTSPTGQRHPTEPRPADHHPPLTAALWPDQPPQPPPEPPDPDDDWETAAGDT
ncbi:MAG: DUF222 domain-containing protein [Geodermatophilaceae bacterium]